MIRTLVLSIPLAMGIVALTPGCTTASSVCDTICECEHCNKYAKLNRCRNMEKSEATADAYDCSEAYTAVLTCTLEKGQCDEETANYSTRANGTCTQQPIGLSCTVDNDCFGATCSNGSCVDSRCDGSGKPCTASADCSGEGADACEKEQETLAECIDAASGK